MKIAILSDSHDHVANAKLAIEQINKLKAEVLLFCGDFCSSGCGVILCDFKGPIFVVFGNNHTPSIEKFGNCLAVNPGSIEENKNGHPPSFALYDTVQHKAVLHALDGSILTI